MTALVIISESFKWFAESQQESEAELKVPPKSPFLMLSILTRLLTPPIPFNETRINVMFSSRLQKFPAENWVIHCLLLLSATSSASMRTFQYSICFKLVFYLVEQMFWLAGWVSLWIQCRFPKTTLTLDMIQPLFHFSTIDPVQVLIHINGGNWKRKKNKYSVLCTLEDL